jgi:PAS domain S-box-containing protein
MLTSNLDVDAQYRTPRLDGIENDLLQAFLEHIPDDVYFKDRDSRFLRISRSLATRFGLSDASLAIGKTDADMFSSEHAEQALADEQEIISTGRAMVGKEEKETWPDGRQTWAFTTKVPLRDKTGRIIGTMGISRDITERKVAEQELNKYKARLEELVEERTAQLSQANAQLECDIAKRTLTEQELARKAHELARSNADLEQFAYVASHDLQEPLRMVASYTQLLARRYKGKLDADADEFIGFAVGGANRMQQLILDLLTYSRLTTARKPLESTDSRAACEAALMNLRQSVEHSGAIVTVGNLPRVLGDPTQLSQLFQNLIGNSIKYCNQHKPQIEISSHAESEYWVFSVEDNGIGIEAQYFERIFQMFQRLHTRQNYSGTGIGLAICRKIVERHGGKIWVESQVGRGSKFIFTIPKGQNE